MSRTIAICKWKTFQHYGKKRPPWIKLYRDVLGDYELMYGLEPAERWVLVGLWMLAAEFENAIPNDLAFLSHRLRAEVTADLLARLQALGKIEDGAPSSQPLEQVYPQTEVETETETETTAAAPPAGIVEKPTYTEAVLAEEARVRLGLGRIDHHEQQRNRRLVREWLYSGNGKRKPEDIMLAIEGLADMRDHELVGWEGVKRDTPMTLAALVKAETLDHTGDGAVRLMWDVAIEHARRLEAGAARASTPRVKGSPMRPVSVKIPESLGGAA